MHKKKSNSCANISVNVRDQLFAQRDATFPYIMLYVKSLIRFIESYSPW